jgi:hypothetical protein
VAKNFNSNKRLVKKLMIYINVLGKHFHPVLKTLNFHWCLKNKGCNLNLSISP